MDFLLAHGPDTDDLTGEEAERDIERTALLLRHRSLERVSQNLAVLQREALDQGDAKATEFSHTMLKLTVERARLERALSERTSLGRREERERVL
jgi:hypothetical protein